MTQLVSGTFLLEDDCVVGQKLHDGFLGGGFVEILLALWRKWEVGSLQRFVLTCFGQS